VDPVRNSSPEMARPGLFWDFIPRRWDWRAAGIISNGVEPRQSPRGSTLSHFTSASSEVRASIFLFSHYGFWKLVGQDPHCLFHHLLKHLTSGFDLFNEPRDLAGEAANVIVFFPLDETSQEA